ncbi:MAG: helix-turn-helix domain-containing protein [Planctomycetes bacterium]|nr:helix-turn-helix domain-containing protein [Planctomycetota bacterium]
MLPVEKGIEMADTITTGDDLGQRIAILRKRYRLSIRKLAKIAKVTPGIISSIERGKTSPSIATLQKILSALDSDLATFFSGNEAAQQIPVLLRERMRVVSDRERSYTIVFPRRENIAVEMLDEQLSPSRRRPPYETLKCDVAGYIFSGELVLEIKGKKKRVLRPGDAFYVTKGQEHRGYAFDEPVRLITVYSPARY